jgi:predicted nucleic acid-binding protein
VLRILGNPRYPNSPGPPAVVAPLLEAWRSVPRHRFWHDRLSLLTPGVLGSDRLLDPSQITDAYLLALAVDHGDSLVTLDRRLRADLVAGGAASPYPSGAGGPRSARRTPAGQRPLAGSI